MKDMKLERILFVIKLIFLLTRIANTDTTFDELGYQLFPSTSHRRGHPSHLKFALINNHPLFKYLKCIDPIILIVNLFSILWYCDKRYWYWYDRFLLNVEIQGVKKDFCLFMLNDKLFRSLFYCTKFNKLEMFFQKMLTYIEPCPLLDILLNFFTTILRA